MRKVKKYISSSYPGCAVTLGFVTIMENPVPDFYYSTSEYSKRCYGWPVRKCHDVVLYCIMGPPVYVAVRTDPEENDRIFELMIVKDDFHVGYTESFSYEELMYEVAYNFPTIRCL